LEHCYLFPQQSGGGPHVTITKARAFAVKALELDDMLAEAHTTLAFIKMRYDYDWTGAEQEFKQSIELNPNYPVTHQFYGTFLTNTGRADEGLREINRALELDPLSATINWSLGLNLYHARRYDEAIAQFQNILQMNERHELTYNSLALTFAQKNMFSDGITTLEKLIAVSKDARQRGAQLNLAYIYALSGRQKEARQILQEQKTVRENEEQNQASGIAKIHLALGDREEALAWLNRGYENRDFNMIFLKVAPTLDPLRDDPRFQDLMRRVGLPQ
jgi:tetratricopeptide (TPR) repeat protein